MKRECDSFSTSAAKQPRADTIRLNVGGRRFETSRPTLVGIPYFEPLIAGRFAHDVDNSGCVFVDRSGDLFAAILQFLRSGQRPAEPILARHATTLLDECAFYGIDSLAQKIRGETCPLDLLLSDRRLREKEMMARNDPAAYEKEMLIDVHAVETTPLPREALELPLLLTQEAKPVMQGSFEDFHRRLDVFSGGLLKELAGIPGLVIAGGSVIGALTQCPAGDIDIFLRTPVDDAEGTLVKIYEAIQRNQASIAKKRLMATRSKNTVSFYRVSGQSVVLPPVQVRLRPCAHARCMLQSPYAPGI